MMMANYPGGERMATDKQVQAAKNNIKKAQDAWQKMSTGEHSRSQPQSRERAKPGEEGTGDYYRIVIRPKSEFETFRNHDVGDKKGIERLAGQRASGSWDTQAWLISKRFAHVENGKLVGDTAEARNVIADASPVTYKEGDIFEGKPRRDVPESEKPTTVMKRAQSANIQKARSARKM
jgi:hypothetical protein